MSEYVFLVGDDYESNNKEYVSIDTKQTKPLSIAIEELEKGKIKIMPEE